MRDIRSIALGWWKVLSADEKKVMLEKHSDKILVGKERTTSTLTGREVEIIYKEENFDYIYIK